MSRKKAPKKAPVTPRMTKVGDWLQVTKDAGLRVNLPNGTAIRFNERCTLRVIHKIPDDHPGNYTTYDGGWLAEAYLGPSVTVTVKVYMKDFIEGNVVLWGSA